MRLTQLRSRPYTLATVLLFAVLLVPFCRRITADWDRVYVAAAQRLAAGEQIFAQGFVYPPINAWLALPWAELSRWPSRLLWYAVNVVALVVFVRVAWQLTGGQRLEGNSDWREHLICWLGLAGSGAFVMDALTNHQTDLVIAALVVLGCQFLMARKPLRGAVLLGVATGLKCTPLLFAAYLGWKRRWLAALTIPLVAAAVNLLPELTHPRPEQPARLVEWADRFLSPFADGKQELGHWHTGVNYNHSLAGFWNRQLLWDPDYQGKHMFALPRTHPAPSWVVKSAILATISILLLFTLVSAAFQRWHFQPPESEVIEYGLVLILMLLMSPQSSKPHFCTLLLPAWCVARAAVTWPSRRLGGLLAVVVLCGLLVNKDLVGKWCYNWLVWYGVITLSAILLHLGCCLALVQSIRRSSVVPLPCTTNKQAA